MTRHALFAIALAAGALPVAAETPSWCASSDLTASERAICSDPTLGLLDQRLNAAYRRAQRVADDLAQERWLANRDNCGWDVTCLEYAYRGRIAELRAISRAAGGTIRSHGAESDDGVAPPPPTRDIAQGGPAPWLGRSDLPWDAASGAAAGGSFDPATAALPMLDEMTPRPWCDAARLNPTERTICANRDLSRFDALLELVYGRAEAVDSDRDQVEWLRLERDACGSDLLCIATAYADRIEALNAPLAREVERRHDVHVPARHLPPPGLCRIWHPERPPERQPPPTGCDVAVPPGAVLIKG